MRSLFVGLLCIIVGVAEARAQSFEAGVHFASTQWSEFEGNDLGIGSRITWLPAAMVGIEADLTVYPGQFPPDTAVPFSGNRFEGLFGVTIGPRLAAVRPFGKVSAGFLQVGETPVGFACIAIFPPPLACTLAGGETMAVYEVGGGVDISTSSRTFVRVDASDRMLKYPGPTLRPDFTVNDAGFIGHALRLTVGGGIRF